MGLSIVSTVIGSVASAERLGQPDPVGGDTPATPWSNKETCVILLFIKGATAYEFQLQRFGISVIHFPLKSDGHYAWYKPWNRIRFHWWKLN